MSNIEKVAAILSELKPEITFTDYSDFVMDGVLDSFDIISLVRTLEQTFAVQIDGAAIVPEHFASFEAIDQLVQSAKPSPKAAA